MNYKPGYQKALDEIGATVHHRENVTYVKDKDGNSTGKTKSIVVAEVTTKTGSVLATAENANAEVAIHKAIEDAAAKRNVLISGGDAKNVDPKKVASMEKQLEEQGKQIKTLMEAVNAKNSGDDSPADGYDFNKHNVAELREFAVKAELVGNYSKAKKPELVKELANSGWQPE